MANIASSEGWAYGPPPARAGRRVRRSLLVLPAALVLLLGTAAIADVLAADGDGLVPVNNNALAFGPVCLGATANADGLVAVKRSGGYDLNAYKAGSTVTVSIAGVVDGGTGDVDVELRDGSIPIPDNWATRPAGTEAGPATAKIRLTGLELGSFSGSVIFSAAGTNAVDRPLSRFVAMPISAEIVDCTPTNRPPRLRLPGDQVIEGNMRGGARVSYSAEADDPEDGELTPSCDPASGDVFPLGRTRVRCSVTDSAGEQVTGAFDVRVVDTVPPALKGMPDSIVVTAQNAGGAVVRYDMPRAVDVVDPDPVVDCAPRSGWTYPLGTTHVTCSATDASGNSSEASFSVTVVFEFGGFGPPVGNGPVQAGSTVPLRWTVRGANGPITDPSVMNYGASGVWPCEGGGGTTLLASATGGTGPRPAGQGFIYNWQSPADASGCHRVTIALIDGSAYSARFWVR